MDFHEHEIFPPYSSYSFQLLFGIRLYYRTCACIVVRCEYVSAVGCFSGNLKIGNYMIIVLAEGLNDYCINHPKCQLSIVAYLLQTSLLKVKMKISMTVSKNILKRISIKNCWKRKVGTYVACSVDTLYKCWNYEGFSAQRVLQDLI